jgi:hypothetical protein
MREHTDAPPPPPASITTCREPDLPAASHSDHVEPDIARDA